MNTQTQVNLTGIQCGAVQKLLRENKVKFVVLQQPSPASFLRFSGMVLQFVIVVSLTLEELPFLHDLLSNPDDLCIDRDANELIVLTSTEWCAEWS